MTDHNRPNPLANQGFPGIGETEAVPVGSNRPMRVRIHRDETAPTLSPQEYRKASARQKKLDAQLDSAQSQSPSQPEQNEYAPLIPFPQAPPNAPKQRVPRGRPVGSGKKSPAPSRTLPPGPKAVRNPDLAPQVTNFDKVEALAARVTQIEGGINKVLELLSQRPHHNPLVEAPITLSESSRPVPETEDDPDWDKDDAAWLDTIRGIDEDPDTSATQDNAPSGAPGWETGDPALTELQQFIQKRQPHKWFRRFWYPICRSAAYQEWPAEMREQFDTLFNQVVTHPQFLHNLKRWARKSRNGQTIGNEQLFRVASIIAGCASIYKLMGD